MTTGMKVRLLPYSDKDARRLGVANLGTPVSGHGPLCKSDLVGRVVTVSYIHAAAGYFETDPWYVNWPMDRAEVVG